jgi:UDP-glucose 4,6-dehydratase
MILLLGSTGYVGSAIAKALHNQQMPFVTASVRFPLDEQQFIRMIIKNSITKIINCSGFVGVPNVDSCEKFENQQKTMQGNVFLPVAISNICKKLGVTFIHISSGCIYNDSNCEKGEAPHKMFTEDDEHNFGFASATSSWYSRSKSLAEHLLQGKAVVCRLRIPFDASTSLRNYLMKVINYDVLLNATNSFSYLPEFANGIAKIAQEHYWSDTLNLTQPGYLNTMQVASMLRDKKLIDNKLYFKSIEEFNKTIAAPRSNCVLDASSAIKYEIKLAPIEDAMMQAIDELTFNINNK